MSTNELIQAIDLHICWECADTRPVFAHHTCERLDNIVKELTLLIGEN
jgi:hypothetical protein